MLKTVPELIALARQNVTTLAAKEALSACQQCAGVIIDVREPAEYTQKALEQSINIPRGILEMQITNVCPKADTPIFIHCATGGRATLAAEQLQRLGYTNVTAITCKLDDICSI